MRGCVSKVVMEKLEKIFKIANNALYFNDSHDFRSALWDVCKEAKPECENEIGKRYIDEDKQGFECEVV